MARFRAPKDCYQSTTGSPSDKGTRNTATPSENTKHVQNKILEMYRDNPSFATISQALGYSETYVRKLYRQALKSIILDNVADVRKLEVVRLDKMYTDAMEVLQRFHPIISSGAVVRDIVEDADGRPVLDENENPVTVRIQDSGPVLAAIDRLLRIQERRSRLLGLDKPTKIAATDPDGEKEASIVQFYLPNNGRENNNEG
jgi:AraC-like DNA-binding protein